MSTPLLSNTTPLVPAPPSVEPQLTRWDDVALESLNPLIDRQLIVGDNIMVVRLLLKKWAAAERESLRAIQINPGYAFAYSRYALLLSGLGRHHEAIA